MIDLCVEQTVFLQASQHQFLICYRSPLPLSASVGANGAMFEFIEVIVPGAWLAAVGAQRCLPLAASMENKAGLT